MINQLLNHLDTLIDVVQRHTIPTPDKDHTDWGKAEVARRFVAGLRRVTHNKRGGSYLVIGEGRLQSNGLVYQLDDGTATEDIPADMMPMVLYVEHDGSLWARPLYEFDDGRFSDIIPGAELAIAPYGWLVIEAGGGGVAWAAKRALLNGQGIIRPATEVEMRLVQAQGRKQ